jgi:hypothetical protein
MICHLNFAIALTFIASLGCSDKIGQPSGTRVEASVQSSSSKEIQIDALNQSGFAKITIRDADNYQEGIVDAQGNEVVRPGSNILVNDITGPLALVQVERKFLFVPLDQGFVSLNDLKGVEGFQFAEPFRCGLAMVIVHDTRFYLNASFEKAFDADFDFAESFHHDRALVKNDDRYRIIDTRGNTVADLNFDQVNPQSPWCWQVTMIEGENFRSGFVDLNGNLITELIYDYVGYYDPVVKRIPVVKNRLHGFVDEYAKVVIPIKYDYAESFDRGKAKVVLNNRTFYINPDGIEVPE